MKSEIFSASASPSVGRTTPGQIPEIVLEPHPPHHRFQRDGPTNDENSAFLFDGVWENPG